MRYSAGSGLVAVMLLAGCGSSGHAQTTSSPPPGRTRTTRAQAHVMVIVEENRGRGEVIGASNMPYFNSLAKKYGNTTNWDGILHSSLPNYLALVSGSTQGISENGCGFSFTGPTIGSQLTNVGISWKAYAEGLPSRGSTACTSGEYAKKHNPFAYFPEPNRANMVPASQFAKDLSAGKLPAFVFYVPNLINDGHDAGNEVVDWYLRRLIPGVLASRWYAHNGTIIITWDED